MFASIFRSSGAFLLAGEVCNDRADDRSGDTPLGQRGVILLLPAAALHWLDTAPLRAAVSMSRPRPKNRISTSRRGALQLRNTGSHASCRRIRASRSRGAGTRKWRSKSSWLRLSPTPPSIRFTPQGLRPTRAANRSPIPRLEPRGRIDSLPGRVQEHHQSARWPPRAAEEAAASPFAATSQARPRT